MGDVTRFKRVWGRGGGYNLDDWFDAGDLEALLWSAKGRPDLHLLLEALLVRHGLVEAAALEDPEGYDSGKTRLAVWKVAEELGWVP